jgi:hypothetical protein
MAPDEKQICICCRQRRGTLQSPSSKPLCAKCRNDPAIAVADCLHGEAAGGARSVTRTEKPPVKCDRCGDKLEGLESWTVMHWTVPKYRQDFCSLGCLRDWKNSGFYRRGD